MAFPSRSILNTEIGWSNAPKWSRSISSACSTSRLMGQWRWHPRGPRRGACRWQGAYDGGPPL